MLPAGNSGGLATKGTFIPLHPKETDVGWGVVHLYRDGHETPGLYGDEREGQGTEFSQEDCTTLCILAVPSYMTPSDLLGFVGEQTREHVSHFRLIKTARANKYMVLIKFWEASKAREWRKEWNGKPFNSMEVRDLHLRHVLFSGTDCSSSPNTAMLSLSNPSPSNLMSRTATLLPTPTSQMILSHQHPQNLHRMCRLRLNPRPLRHH